MTAPLEMYESMSELSAQMVEAATTNDWDRLCELEGQVARLRDRLIVEDPITAAPRLDEATRARKIALIRKLLADDREIRSHAEPWMESVRVLLSGSARQRAVQNAYGADR